MLLRGQKSVEYANPLDPKELQLRPASHQALSRFFQHPSIADLATLFAALPTLLSRVCLAWSMRYGLPAGSNPWGAAGLEWRLSSPPPAENVE